MIVHAEDPHNGQYCVDAGELVEDLRYADEVCGSGTGFLQTAADHLGRHYPQPLPGNVLARCLCWPGFPAAPRA